MESRSAYVLLNLVGPTRSKFSRTEDENFEAWLINVTQLLFTFEG